MSNLANILAAKRSALICALCLASLFLANGIAPAAAETRTLKLYYINTGERATITFKKNGRYVQSGLTKLNKFLRDWRRKESIKMDPRLFDLVWEVHKATGSRNSIHVVSAYRSPATNAMLRRTRGGQATKSQHMYGRAMDFYIPGVKSSNIRKIGLKKGWGGVGYYPRSNSPYVHLDTARVRHWPRMSRKQLVALFPNGRTLHTPPDGRPLKNYKLAAADDKKRRAGRKVKDAVTPTLLAALGFGKGGNDAEEAPENVQIPRAVQAVEVASLPQRTAIPRQAPREILIARLNANQQSDIEPDAPAQNGPLSPAPEPQQDALIASATREEEPITIALLPRSAPRDSLPQNSIPPTDAAGRTQDDPNFGGQLLAAHEAASGETESKTLTQAELLASLLPAEDAVQPEAQAQEPITIALLPKERPEPPQADPIEVAAIQNAVANTQSQNINNDQTATPSDSAFTPDGSIAIGRLSGSNVVNWAVASTNASNVSIRGLRPPAYGQNAIRLPSAKMVQKGFSQNVNLAWNRLNLS